MRAGRTSIAKNRCPIPWKMALPWSIAAQKANRIIQIAARGSCSILYAKAKEIFGSGRLGDVIMIEAYSDRNTAMALGSTPFHQTQTNKRSTGTLFWMERRSDPLTPSGCSVGVALRLWRGPGLATSLFT